MLLLLSTPNEVRDPGFFYLIIVGMLINTKRVDDNQKLLKWAVPLRFFPMTKVSRSVVPLKFIFSLILNPSSLFCLWRFHPDKEPSLVQKKLGYRRECYYDKSSILITETLDEDKISDNKFEWHFDNSFIILSI